LKLRPLFLSRCPVQSTNHAKGVLDVASQAAAFEAVKRDNKTIPQAA